MSNYQPTAFFREITSRIRGHLARFDINQADLAVLCDVSQSQFSKIIRGARPMTIDQLAVICDAIEIDLEDLVATVQKFLNDRAEDPSPLRFVVDEERVADPSLVDEKWLDAWGAAARQRVLGSRSNVVPIRPGVRAPKQTEPEQRAARRAEKEPTDEQ